MFKVIFRHKNKRQQQTILSANKLTRIKILWKDLFHTKIYRVYFVKYVAADLAVSKVSTTSTRKKKYM